jgi:hypothetical protein
MDDNEETNVSTQCEGKQCDGGNRQADVDPSTSPISICQDTKEWSTDSFSDWIGSNHYPDNQIGKVAPGKVDWESEKDKTKAEAH